MAGIAGVAVTLISAAAFAAGDAAAGEKIFNQCKACHAVGPEAKNKIGPDLNGVVGRKWGAAAGFSYSSDLKTGGEQGKIWDEVTLDDYLTNPKHLAPHGRMPFPGLKDPAQRANVIEYVRQFAPDGSKK